MAVLLSDLANVLSDPGDARAVQDILGEFGDTFPDDSLRQNSYDRNYTFEEFESQPMTSKIGGGYAGGTTGDENAMKFESNIFEYHILGAGQTITAPSLSSTGLNVGMDQTNDEGIEMSQGITSRSTVATDLPFFFKLRFTIPVVAGTDDCAMGFRKAEAYQANIDDYDEMACLNVISGNITIETILNDGTTATQDTGNASEVVIPFFYFLHANASQAGAITIVSWECGPQSAQS